MNTQIKVKSRDNQFSINLYIFLVCLNIASRIISSSTLSSFLFIEKSLWNSILIKITIFGCFGIFLLNKKYVKRKILIMLILSIFTIITTVKSNNMGFVQIFSFILAYPDNLDIIKIAKWQSYTFNWITAFVFFMYKTGFITGVIDWRDEKIRNSCGFTSANGFANTILLSLMIFMYYKQDKWKLKHSIIWTSIIVYVYTMTNSRMSFIFELVVVAIMTFRYFKNKNFEKFIFILSKYAFNSCLIFSILITILYANGYFTKALTALNALLTYRLSYMMKYFKDPGITLFGQGLTMVSKAQALSTGERWSGLDNSYMYMLIVWGIVGIFIFTLFMYMLAKYLKSTKNYYGALYTLIISFVGITENFLVIVPYNFTIILIAQMISERKKRRNVR